MSLLLFFNNGVTYNNTFFAMTSQLGKANSMLGNVLLGYYADNTDFNSVATLYVRGDIPPTNSSNDFNMSLVGSSGINNNFTLFVQGCIISDSGMPLHMNGEWPTGTMPLYIYGMDFSTENIPLYLRVNEPGVAENSLQLTIYGNETGVSGQTAGMPLFLECTSGNRPTANIPMFISGPGVGSGDTTLNLFINGYYQTASQQATLFLQNLSGIASIPLYIRGSGVTAGALPFNTSLDLYIHRTNAVNIMPLYLRGPGDPAASSTPFYMYGHNPSTSGVNLVIANVYERKNNNMKLYTHGF